MTASNKAKNPTKQNTRFFTLITLAAICLLGGFVRFVHVINLDFPLNDGGPFYLMMQELQEASYTLPIFTAYNQMDIPFAYPPLGFYLGAGIGNLFKVDLLDVLRLLPASISTLTIPAFYYLSRRFLKNDRMVLAATFGFTFLPTSFDWLIVGAGLTRALGYLFAILTLGQVHALFTKDKNYHLLLAIIFASLTILSHPGTAYFAFYCSLIILAFHIKGRKKNLIKSFLVGLGTLILTSPWWATIISRHGYQVLIYPFQTEGLSITAILTPFTFLFTNEPLLEILAFCGFFGVIISLRNRSYLLPVWLFLIFVFESRLGATYSVVPMSLLIGVGIVEGFFPILSPIASQNSTKNHWLPAFVMGFFTIYVIINAYVGVSYQVVTSEQRTAMEWIRDNTPVESKFLVLTGQPEYGIDQVSEWFPTLSHRTSMTTPQVHEWLPGGEFSRRIGLHKELQACATQDLMCVKDWAEENQIGFTHIYVSDPNQITCSQECQNRYEIIYKDLGGEILAVR